MIADLAERLGDKVSTNDTVRDLHGRDENYPDVRAPLAVVFAESVEDIAETLAFARRTGTPVIPFSAGSSLEGHLVPMGDAISLDLSRMNRVLAVRPEDFLAVVEPGITRHLHPVPEHVHALRVFFPSLAAAAETAYMIMAGALPVARLELIDALSIRAVNRYLGRDYPEKPALFVEFHSSTAESIAAESRDAEEIAREAGALSVDVARTQAERTAQWEARHNMYLASRTLYPG